VEWPLARMLPPRLLTASHADPPGPPLRENAMKRTAIVISLLAFTTPRAAAFSSPGHQAIADVAQDRLSRHARGPGSNPPRQR
jgi:hypothetical protein